MSMGTRPLGWLFNLFSRKPQGLGYQLLESVQPTIDVGQDWPLIIQPFQTTIATVTGPVSFDLTVPQGKHRLWLALNWSGNNVNVYQTGAVGASFNVTCIILGATFPPILSFYKLDAQNKMDLNDVIPVCGQMVSGMIESNPSSNFRNTYQAGNWYQNEQMLFRLQWTNQTVGANISLRGLYIERDANQPLPLLS